MQFIQGIFGLVLLVLGLFLILFWAIFPWMVHHQLRHLNEGLKSVLAQLKDAATAEKARQEQEAIARAQLPPVPGTELYYVALKGEAAGPHKREAIESFLAKNTITVNDWILRVGDREWRRLRDVFEVGG
jgi:hypothetical protein